MDKLRFGIIGIGNMGSGHAKNLTAGKVPNACLTAVCDIKESRRQWARETLPESVEIFENTDQFFANAKIDAVIVAVPHYLHPVLGMESLKNGFHVLVEKPAGVYTKAVREMNAAADASNKVYGVMFNQRTNPVYQKVKELMESGELGQMKRVVWEITSWYRSQSYYDSGDWRATWGGEGGGVLLNQDPHQLDLWQWMCGMPTSIRAFMDYGKCRNIEVENDVTAIARYANGANGVFITSTHETPGTNRLEISADMGKLVVENDVITFWRNRVGETEFNATYTKGFGSPECWKAEIPVKGPNPQHLGILENFASACLKGTPLLAPGQEGIKGVSISNAMHLSAWTDKWVDPSNIDEDLFYQLLQEKIKTSKFKKETKEANLDTAGTY
ncbi:MAG: Gfo/Idh/MocA family oxidoreductase [Oscillospiraceae bacterium]|jgi:predicted dehydrogenase|nr:Gfo/Idh/MocA family oxidoreductase [Oscillospiraceae bacterium]